MFGKLNDRGHGLLVHGVCILDMFVKKTGEKEYCVRNRVLLTTTTFPFDFLEETQNFPS